VAICGLCAVATAVVARGGAAKSSGVLERSSVGCTGAAAVADGPGAAVGATVPGRQREVRAGSALEPAAEGARAARGNDAVHDAVRRLCGVVGEIEWSAGPGDRDGDCEPAAHG